MSAKRLGLLTCDAIWEPLRSRHGDYQEMYSALLANAGARFELHRYAVDEGELPASPTECDAWLISGSRAGVYEPLDWIPPAMALVRDIRAAGLPQVGICFGHQLLAEALGGKVEPAPGGWGHGNVPVTVGATPDGSPPPPEPVRLFVSHQDQVVQLPPGARWLASASHCPNAMFVLGTAALGIQPHPEFTAAFMREMTLEEPSRLDPELRRRSLETMDDPVDSNLIGLWIGRFLGLIPGR